MVIRLLSIFFIGFTSIYTEAREVFSFESQIAKGAMGTGNAKGYISTVMIKTEAVKTLLKPEMTLKQLPGVPEGWNPVVFYVGQHLGLTATPASGIRIPIENQYSEITFSIPNVQIAGYKGTYTYLPLLRLDSTQAIVMGWFYGLPKKHADFLWEANRLSIKTANKDLTHFAFFEVPDYQREHFAQNIEFLKENSNPLVVSWGRGFLCVDFMWNFSAEKMQPVRTQIDLFPAFSGAAHGHFESPSLDASSFGSVRIDTQWTMSALHSCQ